MASQKAKGKSWSVLCESHSNPDSPCAVSAAISRLLTGHECLNAYLLSFNFTNPLDCNLCDFRQAMLLI